MTELSAQEARVLLADLFRLKPVIYWCDFLTSTIIAYGALALYLSAVPFSVGQAIAFVVAGCAVFRTATFMHEIVHFRKDQMRLFKLAWNVFVGIPLLTPSLFYTSHADHHSARYYGTVGDGEFLPLGSAPPREILRFLAMIPLVPLLAVARALILIPVSIIIPSVRRWLLENASAAVISPSYRRRQVPSNWDPYWLAADLSCFVFAFTVAMCLARDLVSLAVIAKLYAVAVFAISLNWIRTLAAHRYRGTGATRDHVAQVLDSINISSNSWFTELLYPVGLRYHALHHLMPALPYHALGAGHRRLLTNLPADSAYHLCNCDSTWEALGTLWRDARAVRPGKAAPNR